MFCEFLRDFFVTILCSFVVFLQPEKVTPSPDNQGFGITSDVWSFGITMVVNTVFVDVF